MFTASELLENFNTHIAGLQFTRTPKGLYAPVEYVLSMGGKRIRPVLMLLAYNLYKEDVARIYAPATGIEVYHKKLSTKFGMIILLSFREMRCWCLPISLWQNVLRLF